MIVFKKLNEAIEIQIEKDKHINRKGEKPCDYIYDQQLRPIIKDLIKEHNGNIVAIKSHLKKLPLRDNDGNFIELVQIAKFKEYAAKRVTLDKTFDEKKIAKIPYAEHTNLPGKKPTLPQQLLQHLKEFQTPEVAFAGEGLEQLYKKLGVTLKKVTIYEAKDADTKFKGSYYETDKGGNVFFVIEQSKAGKKGMYSLPLPEAIERLSNKLPLVDVQDGFSLIILSPNELVYIQDEDEKINGIDLTKDLNPERIYKMVSCSGPECYFLPHAVAGLILPYTSKLKNGEFGSLNKSENTIESRSIKNNCVKLKIDRLGFVKLI